MPDAFQQIRLQVADAVATVTLNRPERLNSFTSQMHDELRRALGTIREDDAIRVMVLTGAGRAFCAGQDLGERRGVAAPEPRHPRAGPELGGSPQVAREPVRIEARCGEREVDPGDRRRSYRAP